MRNWIITLVLVLLAAPTAGALTLNVDGTGQLLGASGVDVGGTLYDVEFLDGTCIALYSGCDEVSDFTFQTAAAAGDAIDALLDQVFIPVMALDQEQEPVGIPFPTRGCSETQRPNQPCQILIPYARDEGVVAENMLLQPINVHAVGEAPGRPFLLTSFIQHDQDTSISTQTCPSLGDCQYSVWSPAVAVPEPGTALLMGFGLIGLSWAGRGRNRS